MTTVLWNDLNQLISVSFFSEDNVLSDEIKICYIFEFKVTKIECSAFLGTPGIVEVCHAHPVYNHVYPVIATKTP